MPNVIKYNVSAQSLSLKKGNFWIGTNDVPKGATLNTEYWNGITPPARGYTIYLNKASQGPSIYVAISDPELVFLTNRIAGTSYTTVNECFTYYSTQTDKMVLNKSYEQIVTNGLILNLDAGFVSSYPRNGNTWYDIAGSNNGTLVNGTTYNSSNSSIVFDGTDDIVNVSAIVLTGDFSITQTMNIATTANGGPMPIGGGISTGGSDYRGYVWFRATGNLVSFKVNGESGPDFSIASSKWLNKNTNYTVTRSGSTAKIYINGVELASSSISTSNFTIRTIGASYAYPAYSCNGNIYSTSIYNRALSLSEILQNYYKGSIVTSGLIMALDAANVVSYPGTGTSWTDLTLTGNNGTLVNGPVFSPSNGGIISFDGSNDYVSCGNFSVSYITVSTWVYRTSSTTNQGICRKNNGWAVSQYNGTLQVAPGTNWQFFNTGYTIPLNQWVNIVYTYNGTTQRVYINGSSIWSLAQAGALPSNGNGVNVGFDDNGWYWGGAIASTLIYNRELTAGEVKQNYEAHASRFI